MAHPPPPYTQALSGLATSALLGIVEQAGLAVVTLVEHLSADDLLRSRLTRAEVQRQLTTLADSLAQLAPTLQASLPDLGWDEWQGLHAVLHGPPGPQLDEALWFASSSLAPATVLWLRVYRKEQPTLFKMTA